MSTAGEVEGGVAAPALSATDLALANEVSLGTNGAGRKPQAALVWTVVRALVAEDIPALAHGTPGESKPSLIKEIRSQHHTLAQLIAQGKDLNDIALLTGYNLTYISQIRSDPTFSELVDYYIGNRELVFVDVLERMKALGISTLEELQQRLAEKPEAFSTGQLMEMTELLLVKGKAGAGTGAAAAPRVAVNVSFVRSPNAGTEVESKSNERGPIIDLEVETNVD